MGGRGGSGSRNEPKKYLKLFAGSNNQLTAEVRHYVPLGVWNGQYAVSFFAFGVMDNDYRGTNGTGMKVYDTEDKAIAAAKRYTKRWEE